ncbi:tRNA (adenosine(37)-N6)-dimethylallyltransferase MiaA [Parapedobacter sp. SGR-10]|uniref:tRNA (adenosine(37)-N6)-dimethylallyltransferase MiaA n=1 Tax=Parapedobacter sp. SGR-10 TaxID=2710879 RepID=UPI0013D5461D|nr:tRNA (adenosine(37)-N6)-dimethylallyltransferase MiaA [Parapedobacter sp. SGR-10]NGF55472.1 tRNA (adenosine(37)-N6)-dimethylallyltransferase MiaA [Parapedobacter sp. SGR-10]
MTDTTKVTEFLRAGRQLPSEDLIIVLGPTASGKTRLAVELAKILDAEIVSADSRQVYRHMDIGTGKDIHEYGEVPYHLIDIVQPGEKYNVTRFLEDFEEAYCDIRSRGKTVIVCGGTGFYIQALLEPRPYAQVPVDLARRTEMETMDKGTLKRMLEKRSLPEDFAIDFSSKKRMVRALEILEWLDNHPQTKFSPQPVYSAKVLGIAPDLETRRRRISTRLYKRLENGMIDEVKSLLQSGLTYEDLEYYGLEYKYISYYLQGKATYDEFLRKLETEIHRYAKRQMTYFRKMEKDGIAIHWIN